MWIYNSMFLLKIDVTSSDLSRNIITNVYDSSFNRLPMKKNVTGQIEQVQIDINLPNSIILEIDPIGGEFSQMSLAGIKLEKNKLSDVILYYTGQLAQPSMDKILELPVQKTVLWNHAGYAMINLFHYDPFAYHMFIGNKIQF
jgi:hypothetical protein